MKRKDKEAEGEIMKAELARIPQRSSRSLPALWNLQAETQTGPSGDFARGSPLISLVSFTLLL